MYNIITNGVGIFHPTNPNTKLFLTNILINLIILLWLMSWMKQ